MEIRALLFAMRHRKIGPLLVAAQVAVTLAVIVNIAYVVHQKLEDAGRPTGMDLNNMFWIKTQPTTADYPYASGVKADLAYLNALPGVVAASTANDYDLPQSLVNEGLPFASNPTTLQKPGGRVGAIFYYGTDKFIEALGLKLIAGRNFSPSAIVPPSSDYWSTVNNWAPETILTQALAKKLFPNGDALGKTVYAGIINKSSVVVGIVELLRANPMPSRQDEFNTRVAILPIIPPGPDVAYIVRAKPGRRDELMARLDKEFSDLQPGRVVDRMESYDVTAARARQGFRMSAAILAVVATCVLAVTVVGIVGLAAFNVATRTKQLGTRRAIGARKFHILRYFLVENWIITTGGIVVGCVLAMVAGVELSRLYQMSRLPLYYLVGGVLLVWLVGLLGVLVPASRAASISPAVATRTV